MGPFVYNLTLLIWHWDPAPRKGFKFSQSLLPPFRQQLAMQSLHTHTHTLGTADNCDCELHCGGVGPAGDGSGRRDWHVDCGCLCHQLSARGSGDAADAGDLWSTSARDDRGTQIPAPRGRPWRAQNQKLLINILKDYL